MIVYKFLATSMSLHSAIANSLVQSYSFTTLFLEKVVLLGTWYHGSQIFSKCWKPGLLTVLKGMLSLHKKCVIASVIIWWRWFPGVSGVALANTLVIEGCEEDRESSVPTFFSPETELVSRFFGLMVAYWTGCFFWRCRSRFDVLLPLFLMACEQTCSLLIVWC